MTWNEVSDLLRHNEKSSVAELAKSFDDDEDDPKVLSTSATSFLESSDHPDSPGRFARYEIMELLGRGGMGILMRGFDTSLNRHSAIHDSQNFPSGWTSQPGWR